jgi:hypothetical protein
VLEDCLVLEEAEEEEADVAAMAPLYTSIEAWKLDTRATSAWHAS